MIPVHLQLSGFLSYQDPVDLDFTTFDLACISGSNGAGKSSLLDAMTWALFGQARRRDDALINSHAQAAEVILDFQYENNLYRIQRTKPREKTTLLEFFTCTEDHIWRPLTEKSVRDTEARISSILRMDYETFTNASFLLQGRADQFAQQRPGDRKRVLSAILGLEIWEQYRMDAAERRKTIEADMKSLDGQLEEIDAELAQETARKQRLQDAETRMEQLHQLRQAKESALASLQRLAATLNEQRQMVELLERSTLDSRRRFERLSSDLQTLIQERDGFQQVLAGEADTRAAYQHWQDLRVELERWDGVAANFREIEARRSAPLTAIATEASRLDQERRTLFTQDQAVQKEQSRLPALESQGAVLAEAMARIEADLQGRAQLEAELRVTQGSAAEALAENRSLREAMKSLKERIDRLHQVEGAICPLCGQPLSPEDRASLVASLETEGKEMGDHYRANIELQAQADGRVRELQTQIGGLARLEDDLRVQSRQHDRLESERQRIGEAVDLWAKGGALRLARITQMIAEEDYAAEARAQLAEIDAESKALGYDAAAHDAVRRAELEGRSAEAGMRELEAAHASLAPLERQIAGLESQLGQEKIRLDEQEITYHAARERYENEAAQLPDLNAAETEVYSIQTEENRLRMEVGMVRQSVAVLATQRERRAQLSAQRENLSQQAGRLKTLERAFSKDGVPALLIEQALPEIETRGQRDPRPPVEWADVGAL